MMLLNLACRLMYILFCCSLDMIPLQLFGYAYRGPFGQFLQTLMDKINKGKHKETVAQKDCKHLLKYGKLLKRDLLHKPELTSCISVENFIN